jgi:sulfite oxidase
VACFGSTCNTSSNPNLNRKALLGASAALVGAAAAAVTLAALRDQKDPVLAEARHTKQQLHDFHQKLPRPKYEPPQPASLPPEGAAVLNDPPDRPDLPIIPLEEVEEHNDEDSMWFIWRGGVYDLTFFLLGHPGGTPRLLMAAGQDLEPYWEVYRQHLRGHVLTWMEKYRIGSLSEGDRKTCEKNRIAFGDMYETDPIRDANNLACTMKPFNGEPRLDLLTKDFYTPNELFYVRNHLAVPDIDPDEYRLIIKGKGVKKHKFTLEDIKEKFPKVEVTTTLQCAGNRREDFHLDRAIYFSPHWVVGAMSTARWGGVRLRDVLKYVGVDADAMALGEPSKHDHIKHLQFEGYDIDETGFTFGGSMPIDKVVDAFGDVILAYEMNGEPLPRDHGFPLRIITPGHAGVRQCKWLHKIILSEHESQKPWQQKSYRGFAPDIDFETDLSHWPPARLDQAPILQEMPVTSMVCHPSQNTIIGMKDKVDSLTVNGVAWSGGGRKIERVDVTLDGGKHWMAAELYKPIEQRRNCHWAWTQFFMNVPLPTDVQERLKKGEQVELDICSKAMNSDFNLQPETAAPYWNARGICANHWYHVKVTLDPNRATGSVVQLPSEFSHNMPTGGKFKEPWGMHGYTIDPKHQTDPRANAAPEAKHF